MAIPNVNQITATLRMMGDQQLQKYAAMHKNDPYILPMAIAESNARKQMRAQGQAQGMGQPQPKVADASIAAMAPQAPQAPQGQLPEEQGIGALPAPNMQQMADGGIAGYAGGSDESLVYDNEPVMRMAEGGIARFQAGGDIQSRYKQESMEMGMGTRMQYSPEVQAFARAQEEASKAGYADRERQRMLQGPYGPAPVPSKPVIPTLNQATMPAAGYTRTDPRAAPSVPSFAAQMADTTGAAPDNTGATTGTTGAPTGPAPTPSVNTATMPGLPGLSDLAKLRQNIYNKQDFKDPAEKQVGALGEEMLAGAERRKKEYEDYEKSQGDVFKGREGRIAARDEEIGKQKESNTGLAFLNAGLAIMSTPGGLATAIGKGAQVGTAQYAAGLDKIRSAQERLEDAKDKMEEMRLNRSDMSFKQRSALSADIDKAKTDAKRMGIDGIRMAADVNEKRASDIFGKTVDMQKTAYEQAGANARTNAQLASQERLAAMPSGEAKTAIMLGTGKTDAERLESGMKRLQEITSDKSGMAAVKLLAETNAKLQAAGQPPVTMADLLGSAKEYSALMYPKVDNIPKTNMLAR